MRNCYLLVIITIVVSSIYADAANVEPKYSNNSMIDVRDFGAIPNDRKDDTEAIEKAVAASIKLRKGIRPENGSYIFCGPAIFFSPGRYLISRQIKLSGSTSLRSNSGKAIIQWLELPGIDDKLKESMFKINAYGNKIENLKFIGGKTHLLFHNSNINQTLIEINSCEFQLATDFSIRAIPSGKADHLSTQLSIRNCKFIFNYRCLENYCDYAAVIDTWIELRQPQMIDGAAFVNRNGHLFFDRIIGVPCADISKAPKDGGKNLNNARWVDNYGSFTAVNSRFGGEGGGIPIIHQFRPVNIKYPWVVFGSKIRITSSSVFTGSTRRPMGSIIVLHALPQMVVLCDNVGPVNNPVFKVAPDFDLLADIKRLKNGKQGKKLKKFILYEVKNNLSYPNLIDSIPKILQEFVNQN